MGAVVLGLKLAAPAVTRTAGHRYWSRMAEKTSSVIPTIRGRHWAAVDSDELMLAGRLATSQRGSRRDPMASARMVSSPASKPGSTAPPEACRTQLSDRRLPPRGLRLRRLAAVDKGTQSRGDCARCRARKWADDPSSKAWSGQRAVGDTYAVVAVRGRTRGHGSRSRHYCDRRDNAQEECSHTCLRSWLPLRRCRSYMPSGCDKRRLGPGPSRAAVVTRVLELGPLNHVVFVVSSVIVLLACGIGVPARPNGVPVNPGVTCPCRSHTGSTIVPVSHARQARQRTGADSTVIRLEKRETRGCRLA